MFDSIKPWISVSYQYKPFIKRNGAGTKVYGDIVSSKCYPVVDTKLVTDSSGAEVVSNTQLYVPGTESISLLDAVIFDGVEHPILSIAAYYRNGIPDIKVVHL